MNHGHDDPDPDPSALESMRRMAYDRSKWLQTCTYEIAKYEYNKEELNQFYDELQDVIGRVKGQYICQLCNVFPKKSFVMPCGHVYCQRCSSRSWNKERQSKCPKCKEISNELATPLYAMDSAVSDMNAFLKEAKYFQNSSYSQTLPSDSKEAAKKLKSMNFVLLQRLKNIESQLMCDFCFSRINQTYLVNCSSEAFTFRPFCGGCDEKYIKFYEKEQGRKLRNSFKFEMFDSVVKEFYEFLDKTVEYSKSNKVPTRFIASGPRISLFPIYKMLAGIIIVGVVLMYYSS